MLKNILYFLLLFIPFQVHSKVDLGEVLFSAFRGSCQSLGSHTKMALGQTANLIKIIRNIQKDDACSEWANSLEATLQEGKSIYYPSSPQSLDRIEREISDLSLALEEETNPTIAQKLASELAQKKIDAINLGAGHKQSLWETRSASLNQLNQLAYTVNSSLRSSSICFEKYPALALQIGGHILGSAEGFNVHKGLFGAGLAGLSTLTQFLIDIIKGLKFKKTLKKLERSSLAQSISCALEGLSRTYCHSKDTHRIIEEVAENRINTFGENWVGLSILKNMGLYNSWISHVTAGSPAGNLIHAFRKKMVIELRSVYEKSKEDLHAHIQEAEDEIKSSPLGQKEAIIKRLIKSLVWIVKPKNDKAKSSPYINSFPENFNCGPLFFYYSPQGERNPILPSMTNCENYIRSLKFPIPDIRTITQKSQQLLLEGQQYVDIRFSLVKEVDPESVLLEGERRGQHTIVSPVEMLRKSIKYLQRLSREYRDEIPPNTQYVISQTANLIKKALIIFDGPTPIPDNAEESKAIAAQKLEGIQKLLAPEMKTSYIEERIKNIVRFEIRKKIEHEDVPDMVRELILLSWNDEIQNLEEFGNMDLENKRHDVQNSMRLSLINLESLGIVYNNSLKLVFRQLLKDEKKYKSEKSTTALIERLCALSLSLPQLNNWTRRLKGHYILRACKRRSLSSIYSPKTLRVSFDENVDAPFSERVCLYYNYMKQNKIYRLLGKEISF